MIRAIVAPAAVLLPATAWAHGFIERYDLPVPLGYFVAGAAAAVALTLLVAVLFARRAPGAGQGVPVALGSMPPWLKHLCRAVSVGLFGLTVAAALWGTADPLMNLAPTFVLIVWWVGLGLVVACIGNIWPALDPWRALFESMDAAARQLGRPAGLAFGWRWPPALGMWPAVALLLVWCGLEVVYPIATVPYRLGCMALAWTVVTLCGMACFGRETWQENADVFAIYFAMLGRAAPFSLWRGMTAPTPAGEAGFVLAMLSTVLFDSLHSGQAWLLIENGLARLVAQVMDTNGYFAGAIGLVAVWLAFFGAYKFTCLVTARLARGSTSSKVAAMFAPTLVPIAVAYNIAHNFSLLVTQAPNAIPLLSDPLGRRWNLFGTAGMYLDVGDLDAKATWTIAITAIVIGHAIAVWLGHRVALREFGAPREAAIASFPLTALMVGYTAVSLLLIVEPMVVFEPPALR